jgi:hypothetical protein
VIQKPEAPQMVFKESMFRPLIRSLVNFAHMREFEALTVNRTSKLTHTVSCRIRLFWSG